MCEVGKSPNVLEIARRLGVLLNHDLFAIQSICSEFVENNSTLASVMLLFPIFNCIYYFWVMTSSQILLILLFFDFQVNKYIRKGRKRRNLISMVQRIVHDHKDSKRLHEALVERCLSDLLDNIGMQFT